jgi:Zn-dependent protease with chaperone function
MKSGSFMAKALLLICLLPPAVAARKAKDPGPPPPDPEWNKVFLRARNGLEEKDSWNDEYMRIVREHCVGAPEDQCRGLLAYVRGRLVKEVMEDPGPYDARRAVMLKNFMSSFCFFDRGADCLEVLDFAEGAARDEEVLAAIALLRAEYARQDRQGDGEYVPLFMAVIEKYPGSSAAVGSMDTLRSMRDRPDKSGAAIDLKTLAELEKKLILLKPRGEEAEELLFDLASMSGPAGVSISELTEIADAYRRANGGRTARWLGSLFSILDNLRHPWRSLGLTLMVLLLPAAAFLLARLAFFHAEDPGRGPLTLKRANILFWALAVVAPVMGMIAFIMFSPAPVLLIHFAGRPLQLDHSGMMPGEEAVDFSMLLIPMLLLLVMKFSTATSSMTRAEIPGRALRSWLPKDYARVLLALLVLAGGASFLMSRLLLANSNIFASFILGAALGIPLFYLFLAAVSPFYAVAPLAPGPIRSFIMQAFERYHVPVREVYEARTSLKMLEWLLTANVFGPVRCYLDLELCRRLSQDEFYTILLHQIGHWRGRHRWKLGAASLALCALLIALTVIGSLNPALGFLVPGAFISLLAAAAILALARWERRLERQADLFVLDQSGMYQDYINATLKLSGLDPSRIDLANLDREAALRPEVKRRIKLILERWRQTYAGGEQAGRG